VFEHRQYILLAHGLMNKLANAALRCHALSEWFCAISVKFIEEGPDSFQQRSALEVFKQHPHHIVCRLHRLDGAIGVGLHPFKEVFTNYKLRIISN